MRKNLWMVGAGLLLCALPAFAQAQRDKEIVDDGTPVGTVEAAAPEADKPKTEAPKATTEDPAPLFPRPVPLPNFWITLDLRGLSAEELANPDLSSVTVPKDWGVKIIMPYVPDPDSACSAAQNRSCGKACGKTGKTMVACDLDITWNPDGTATRTVVCTCAIAGPQDPRIAGSHVDTFEIRLPDVPDVPDTP